MVNLSLARTVAFDPYAKNRTLGGFILIDKLTQETVGAGMIDFALRRAANIHWQALTVNQSARATAKNQQPLCLWFTGLSGSGKSTLSNLLEKRLHAEGRHTYLLDGDNVRHGLNRDLGFTEEDRAVSYTHLDVYKRQSGRTGAGRQSLHSRLGLPHRCDENSGAETGVGSTQIRRGIRRCAARRGEITCQGAGVFLS